MSGKTEWVMVPRDPTEAMHTAHAMYGDTSDWWTAVLVAAAQPPAEAQAQGGGELSDDIINALDDLDNDADTLRSTGDRAMSERIRGARNVLSAAIFRTAPPSAPVGVDDALVAGAMEAAADACSRHVVCNEAITAAVEYTIAQQPAAVDGAMGVEVLRASLSKLADEWEAMGDDLMTVCAGHVRDLLSQQPAQPRGSQ